MNTKHTPGPWMVTAHNHIKCDLRPIGLTAEAGQTLASVVGGPTSGLSFPQSADEVSANARLIAAAPEQHEELARIEAKVAAAMPSKHDDLTAVSVTFTGADLAKLRAIIAKATQP